MELRVSDNGRDFPNVFIPEDVTLFVDGEGDESPYFWALGAEFGVRAEVVEGGCESPVCPEDSPVWLVEVFERTMNGAGGEFASTGAEIRGHLAPDVTVSEAVAYSLDAFVRDPLLAMTAYVQPEGIAARFMKWGSDVASELLVRAGAEAFASLVLDEV